MKRTGFLLVAFLGAAFFPSFGMATFLGPYSGTVTDSQTDEPVAGASVLLYSEKKVFAPPEGYSEVIRASLVYTDKAGSYHIPRALASLGLLASLDRTGIVIYQPGYQAYIKFKWHRERERKSEAAFRETGNIVKLDGSRPNFTTEPNTVSWKMRSNRSGTGTGLGPIPNRGDSGPGKREKKYFCAVGSWRRTSSFGGLNGKNDEFPPPNCSGSFLLSCTGERFLRRSSRLNCPIG